MSEHECEADEEQLADISSQDYLRGADKESFLGRKPTSEDELEETGAALAATSGPPKYSGISAEWLEKLQIEERREKAKQDFKEFPDLGELQSGVTRHQKKKKLSAWQQEQLIKDKLQIAEAVRLYREAKERQRDRERSPSRSEGSRMSTREEFLACFQVAIGRGMGKSSLTAASSNLHFSQNEAHSSGNIKVIPRGTHSGRRE
ncbi:uncharacterized protein LOC131199792 [Ahaetulla prasina]|uniref:uncharacterized protein LOC131199792 n=1 Tax=Ahaetulla prasina TaxID=499056 RepID=UPI002648C904|nr:uncharacterized protein LOC131199792 [Ahaetulla prasina]